MSKNSVGSTIKPSCITGDWVCVKFANEDVKYVFDGEGTTLNDLFGIS